MDAGMNALPVCEPWFRDGYASAVQEQLQSGWVGPAQTTERFARGIADYVGSSHCLLTTSGTIALAVAAVAIGLRAGDEILIPSYGVISTASAFASIGLRPRLVDIDRVTGCISPADLEKRITPHTRAVCFVNFSGYTGPNLLRVASICSSYGLPLIEDAAGALGHFFQGRSAGTFGTVGTLSFSVPKIVTTGQGGAVLTSSAEYYRRAADYIDHGDQTWRKTGVVHGVGTNLRFNDILASFGLAQLKDIQTRLERKRAIFDVLRSELSSKIYETPSGIPLHYVVFTARRDELIEHLRARGIQAFSQYRVICQHPAYQSLHEDDYPDGELWTERAVYLPFGLALSPDDAERIVESIRRSQIELDDVGGDS